MQLEVLHQTRYDYEPTVDSAQHVACLHPLSQGAQQLLAYDLQIEPAPGTLHTRHDVYGNLRHHFSLHQPHRSLLVSARSVVQTAPAPAALPASAPWEQVRAHYRYRAGGAWDEAAEFVFASPCVAPEDAFAEFAAPSFTPGRPLAEAAWDLMRRLYRHMRYAPASTQVHTPAIEALQQGSGVCQDFAHILLACLRSLGLPARYVSGYLLTQPPPGQSRLIGSDASHAWVQVHCLSQASADLAAAAPGFWLDLDPTNDCLAGEAHVTLARGRDFLDVSPLRGVLLGGARHALSVAVTVRPAGEPRPQAVPPPVPLGR